MTFFLVAVGGGLGATLRYAIICLFERWKKPFFYATFIVNTAGSFVMGISLAYSVAYPQWWLFISIGLLGGLTTFSTFAFDIVRLQKQRDLPALVIYTLFTLFVAMIAIAFGYYLAS
ncbi:MAG: CrcB family protein [Kurthia sp.]|nr:CrcB family protein [Candidatus Kurthia equi]